VADLLAELWKEKGDENELHCAGCIPKAAEEQEVNLGNTKGKQQGFSCSVIPHTGTVEAGGGGGGRGEPRNEGERHLKEAKSNGVKGGLQAEGLLAVDFLGVFM